MLFWHWARKAAARTFWTAGRSRPIRIAMIAITTSSSISVKPCRCRRMGCTLRRTRKRRKTPPCQWQAGNHYLTFDNDFRNIYAANVVAFGAGLLNHPPSAQDGTATLNEDTSVTGTLVATDGDGD